MFTDRGAGRLPRRRRLLAVCGALACVGALSGAGADYASAYGLSVSKYNTRSSAVSLAGQTYSQSSTIYVFVPSTGVDRVSFYLDDPSMTRAPRRVEDGAPYDFNGTASDGRARGFALNTVSSGTHTITAKILATNGTTHVVSGKFTAQATLLWADEFNGTTLDTNRWSAYDGPGNFGFGLRRPSAISVSNGTLIMTAKTVSGQLVSGGMSGRPDFRYGRVEFRVRTESDSTGTMSGVILTYPLDQWSPEYTENDIYETGYSVSRWPFRTFIHYGYEYYTQKRFEHQADASQWHTMAMDWRPGALRIYRDGALVWTITETHVIPDVVHRMCVQLDARAERTVTTPVRMYVDYVRIYY